MTNDASVTTLSKTGFAGHDETATSLFALQIRFGGYEVRLATTEEERLAAFRLRFLVFNLELNEGLDAAYRTGHDTDDFDAACDHLIVEHLATENVVGTYRLQTGQVAQRNFGYYGELEFDFSVYEPLRAQVVELGRACIHRDHRSSDVLYLLWRGIARYAVQNGGRYLIGCSSLTSQDDSEGWAAYSALRRYEAALPFRTNPQPACALSNTVRSNGHCEIPKLLRTYLAIGARICGPPAIDRDFKTIDFLTLLDLQELHPRMRTRFLDR